MTSKMRRPGNFLMEFSVLFFAVSLVLTIVTGLFLGQYLSAKVARDANRLAIADTHRIADAIEHFVDEGELQEGFGPASAKAIDDFVQRHVIGASVLRANVWNRDGTIVYSSLPQLTGESAPANAALGTALAGGSAINVEEVGEDGESTVGFEGQAQILEAYTPIEQGSPPVIVGVVETYNAYDPVAASIASTKKSVFLGIAAAFAVLFAGLMFLVKRGSDRIRRQHTDLESHAQWLKYLAYHDALTGLPNRELLKDRLSLAISQARRSGSRLAVMFLDLDNFKVVNDTLGHAYGDELLKRVGEQLALVIRAGDSVARLGGDEFMLLLPSLPKVQDAVDVAARVLEQTRRQAVLAGQEFQVTASLGIAIYPDDGEDVESLLKNADAAMYRAKEKGRDNYQLYDASMNAATVERLTLESGMRHGLERGEFVLDYQPIARIDTGELTAVEALVRWQHPERGLLPPMDFIPLAEDTGLIKPLGEWVLRSACAQNKVWQEAGLPAVRMSVNVSARQFLEPGFAELVASIVAETGLDPAWLQLEITESVAMQRADLAVEVVEALRALGVWVVIDDFGTGYSSMSYLKDFSIQALKIDRSFIKDLTDDPNDGAIPTATIAMAHGLRLGVIAEGVETEQQLAWLRSWSCDEYQGYLLGRPVRAAEIEKILARNREREKPVTRRVAVPPIEYD
ncbi:MAG: EAL domain-containing protein [Dehalococcoidia bacterium]|nr:EAL domain-containing protein [Dehalococcoidia bacterium]